MIPIFFAKPINPFPDFGEPPEIFKPWDDDEEDFE